MTLQRERESKNSFLKRYFCLKKERVIVVLFDCKNSTQRVLHGRTCLAICKIKLKRIFKAMTFIITGLIKYYCIVVLLLAVQPWNCTIVCIHAPFIIVVIIMLRATLPPPPRLLLVVSVIWCTEQAKIYRQLLHTTTLIFCHYSHYNNQNYLHNITAGAAAKTCAFL